ncbi:MAG: CaiB/BaiF CoA transferase family protein [Gemmatimonadaceae bacterium]
MLSGLRVLDLTRVLAGPLATMMLGDLGADVIKVERPRDGDETRGWGPPFDGSGQSAYFLSVNRNKKSVVADLNVPGDRNLVVSLMATADVVVDNFRSGMLERRDLSPRLFLADHPSLIWCTITGFGPEVDRPGYDFVLQAERGLMAITGEPEGKPTKVGVALADILAGKDAVIAILAALVARGNDPSRRGQRVFISISQSTAAALVNIAQNALVTGEEAERWGNAHPNLVPYQLFETADRPLVIAVGSDAQWIACALTLSLSELAADRRLDTNAGRVAQRALVVSAMSTRLLTRSAAEWQSDLGRAGVPCGVVKGVLEMLREVECSPLTGVAPSVPGRIRYPPPMLDEHGDEIRRLGWAAFSGVGSRESRVE